MLNLWKRLTLTAKITLLFTTLNLLILIVYSFLIINLKAAEEFNGIDRELDMAAKSYIQVIGEENIDRAFTGSVPQEEYKADIVRMGNYANHLGLKSLRSMTVIDSKAKYIHDGVPQSDIESNFTPPMADYTDASPKFFAAWDTWTPQSYEYTDSLGAFRSYFLPFTTSSGNKVIIGADMNIDDVKQKISKASVSQISIAISVLVFSLIITLLCSRTLAGQMIKKDVVESRTKAFMKLQNAIMRTMTSLTELRDDITGGHVERTQQYLGILLNVMKKQDAYREEVSSWDIDLVLQSSQLHDVGKIATEDSILKKPGPLTPEEFEQIKEHTVAGEKIILKMGEYINEQAFLDYAKILISTHHEKWDGSGYPNGLKGEAIPLLGRAMAIVDVYDALVSDRPYKEAFSREQSIEIMKNGRGTHFDPLLLDLFLGVLDSHAC